MAKPLSVTAVTINFNTPDLTRQAVESFRIHYPELPLLVIDNGSRDGSVAILSKIRQQSPDLIEVIFNEVNLHHGPGMDQALRYLHTPYVLFLDSDCEIIRGGFVESMLILAEAHHDHYAVGKLVFMNQRGFDVPGKGGSAIPYVRPYCMILKREIYFKLPPFERHGTPCLKNMQAAARKGFNLIDYPVENYIHHQGRGTAARYGYRLNWRSRLNYLLNKFGL